MVSDVIRHRFAAIFQSLDRNRDGLIDGTDFEVVVTSLVESRGLEPGSPEANEIRDKINPYWEGLRDLGDADGDGRVTLEEFVSSMTALAGSQEGLAQVGLAVAEQMITAMDADGDGRLDRKEYHDMMGAWGASEAEMDIVFNHMDSDGDGYVSREELMHSVRGFFQDESPAPHLWSPTEDG